VTVSNANDLREQVARAIYSAARYDDMSGPFGFGWGHRWVATEVLSNEALDEAEQQCIDLADAALAVAEPAIRADERKRVIEELANSADAAIMAGVFGRMPLADWLLAQK
jgi:hypothetical protein